MVFELGADIGRLMKTLAAAHHLLGSPVEPTLAAACAYQTVLDRKLSVDRSILRLSDGQSVSARRFLPIGKGDIVTCSDDRLAVFAKRDHVWIDVNTAWSRTETIDLKGIRLDVTFKEIESATELRLFNQLRQFHYRGGGGAGRTLPLIGVVDAPDLPRVIGFVELTSAMIANTARKRFFDGAYREATGLGWTHWDHRTSRDLSALICRISRFVIHPELRGLGLARPFARAAAAMASERWHYGGYRPRFLEITADMLRYYPFVGEDFVYIGETEGNEHRVSKDMNYLVKRALSKDGVKAMPQGGGGIMALQRGYATTLLDYIKKNSVPLEAAVAQLQYDPAALDQQSWEQLHRLNRRPKPCYIAGLSEAARAYVRSRALQQSTPLSLAWSPPAKLIHARSKGWVIDELKIDAEADIVQSRDGRILQDAFGFVGRALGTTVVPSIDLRIAPGRIALICGASGAGKSLLLVAIEHLLRQTDNETRPLPPGLAITGRASGAARVGTLPTLDPSRAPLDLLGPAPLASFLSLAARCGLAEPQLLVRPIWTLSSGQKYRLQIALALLSAPDVLLIDNFCEALDRFSSRAVCKGLTMLTRELNVAAVLATAAYDRLDHILAPDSVVMLRRGDDPSICAGGALEI